MLPFKLERTDETLTAHGGLALSAEFNHGLGSCGLADQYLPGPGSKRGYAPSVFVDQLILMLQAGGQCLEDLRELTREAGRLRLLGRAVIPDPDTVGDWLRRMGDPQTGQAGLVGLGRVQDALNARILRRDGIAEYTLDVDATLVVGEKRDAHWSYTGEQGYSLLLRFLFETPVRLADEFLEDNVSPGAGPLEFSRQCRTRMPLGKRLARYRADNASYPAALINELETDHVRRAITADQDVAVKAAFWLSITRDVRPQNDLFEPARGPYAYHAVASNWPAEEKTAHAVLRWHNQSGQAENFNKEVKNGGAGAAAVWRVLGQCRALPDRGAGVQPVHRLYAPGLSRRMGVADDCHGVVETGAGGRTDSAPCGTSGLATRVGGRGARLLAHHPTTVLGTGRGDLTRRRCDNIGGSVAGRARCVFTCRSMTGIRQQERERQRYRTPLTRRKRGTGYNPGRQPAQRTLRSFYLWIWAEYRDCVGF